MKKISSNIAVNDLPDLEELLLVQSAEVCGCSPATVKARVHRARRRLKEALED